MKQNRDKVPGLNVVADEMAEFFKRARKKAPEAVKQDLFNHGTQGKTRKNTERGNTGLTQKRKGRKGRKAADPLDELMENNEPQINADTHRWERFESVLICVHLWLINLPLERTTCGVNRTCLSRNYNKIINRNVKIIFRFMKKTY